eukprot:251555-Prymnesium_polylepis.3
MSSKTVHKVTENATDLDLGRRLELTSFETAETVLHLLGDPERGVWRATKRFSVLKPSPVTLRSPHGRTSNEDRRAPRGPRSDASRDPIRLAHGDPSKSRQQFMLMSCIGPARHGEIKVSNHASVDSPLTHLAVTPPKTPQRALCRKTAA